MLKKTSHASFHAHAQLEISIVLPIHNEEETLPTLVERLTSVLEKMELNYELVFVDDGSRDSSWKIIQEFHEATPHRIRGISLSKNFGQHIAVSAGLDSVLGEFAVIMDSDLQDRPEEIPKLYSKIREGFDCVYAIRRNRRDSWFKKLSSKLFYRLNNRLALVQIPENISLFRIINRNFIEHFRQIRESERFIVGLMAWMGFRQVGVEVEHDHRFAGETKYPLSRMIRLAMNNITSLSWRPLQVLTGLGFSIAVACSVVISWLVFRRAVWGLGITGWTSVMIAILFMGGVQLVALGILGEYVGRTFMEEKKRPLYMVQSELMLHTHSLEVKKGLSA